LKALLKLSPRGFEMKPLVQEAWVLLAARRGLPRAGGQCSIRAAASTGAGAGGNFGLWLELRSSTLGRYP